MRSLSDIDVNEVFVYLKNLYDKTTKRQRILFLVIVISLISGYFYGKNWWERYQITKQAKNIITKIVKSEKDFFAANGKYATNIFKDKQLANNLGISSGYSGEDTYFNQDDNMRGWRNSSTFNSEEESSGAVYSGDFYIEVDPENTCLVLKYKKNTLDKTIFYASFEKEKVLCQGKKCLKESTDNESLCYLNGGCFISKQTKETERLCGGGKGSQTRECSPSCEGGTCGEWSACVCEKGFGWDGKTCKQLQTEADCSEEQCFNGIYCEDKEILTKNIENGSCQRFASCQKNSGWKYSSWKCSCNNETFCPSNEKCFPYPGNTDQIALPNQEGSCTDIHYTCEQNQGWVAQASNCVCDKIGTFWDSEKGEAKCSDCTKKPENAIYVSAGKDGDNCLWECPKEYQKRKGSCVKPNGQFLCVRTETQICTDEFSKKRKLKIDERNNEGQSCFTEDNDNVLYFDKKTQACQICQCVDLKTGKISR